MEGLVHALLIQRTLHGFVEQPLVHVAVVRAQCGTEDFIAYVETIDGTNGIWANRGEHLLEARLERRNVFVA